MSTGIGKRIKEKRLELGISQEELAKRLGLKSKSTICKIERGEDNLTADTVNKYADALNCSPLLLMGWEEEDGIPENAKLIDISKEHLDKALELYHEIYSLPQKDQDAILTLLNSLRNTP